MSESSSACSRASVKRIAFQIAGPARRASPSRAASAASENPPVVDRVTAASEPIVSPSARRATVSAERGSLDDSLTSSRRYR